MYTVEEVKFKLKTIFERHKVEKAFVFGSFEEKLGLKVDLILAPILDASILEIDKEYHYMKHRVKKSSG